MTKIDTNFETVYRRMENGIVFKYGIEVSRGAVFNDNTGDFNGNKITVDSRLPWDYAVSILGHLFGHSVQWNVSEKLRQLGQENVTKPNTAELGAIYDYEKEASRYALALMHEADVTHLDQWVSDMWAADWEWLKYFYTTGERLDAASLVVQGAELLTPLAIPPFKPQKFESRWSF